MSKDKPIGLKAAKLADAKTKKSLREHTSNRLTSKLDKMGHWVYMSERGEYRYTDGKGREAFERSCEGWELALRYLLEDWDGGHIYLYSREDMSPWWYVDPDEDDYS